MGGKVLELESDKLIEQGLELGRLENQMATAVKMLQVGKYTIEEIADKLGYHERSYFEKIFKQYCGITPAEYRKKHTTLKKFNTI